MNPFETPDPTAAPTERITTRRAEQGLDLWIAIEAAQYARVILCEEPHSEAEREAQTAFIDSLTQHVEDWEEAPPMVQSTALEDVGRRLADLDRNGFCVHWAVTERAVDQSEEPSGTMPLAVLIVDATAGQLV